ncbi:MAG TPA: hypothetical protein VHA76_01260 [Solirubrobacterales bacterium]|nr:hypothetical protein [Solirubrobacterales bacterium]
MAAAVAAAVLACVPVAGGATKPAVAIRDLNRQRARWGIPPVRLDQSLLKSSCTAENHYVASPSTSWSPEESPWYRAPLHQAAIFNPLVKALSWGEYQGFPSNVPGIPAGSGTWGCMWADFGPESQASLQETGSPRFYDFLSERGPNLVAPEMRAIEGPTTPAELVGLAADAETGPEIVVWALGLGPSARVVSASLGPEGGAPVVLRVATSEDHWHGVTYIPAGEAIFVPVQKLSPITRYEGTVVWESEAGVLSTQHFGFRTSIALAPRRVHLGLRRVGDSSVEVTAPDVLVGRPLDFEFWRLRYRCFAEAFRPCEPTAVGSKHREVIKIRARRFRLHLPFGTSSSIMVRVEVKDFVAGGYRYDPSGAAFTFSKR